MVCRKSLTLVDRYQYLHTRNIADLFPAGCMPIIFSTSTFSSCIAARIDLLNEQTSSPGASRYVALLGRFGRSFEDSKAASSDSAGRRMFSKPATLGRFTILEGFFA
jgi:hypothetical protein